MFILNSIHTGYFGVYVDVQNFSVIRIEIDHKIEGGWVLLWNSSFGIMISHTTFCRNKALFQSITQIQFCVYCTF